jgi:hypothetical protein
MNMGMTLFLRGDALTKCGSGNEVAEQPVLSPCVPVRHVLQGVRGENPEIRRILAEIGLLAVFAVRACDFIVGGPTNPLPVEHPPPHLRR